MSWGQTDDFIFSLDTLFKKIFNLCYLFTYCDKYLPARLICGLICGAVPTALTKTFFPRRTPFWPKPQKGAKTLLFPGAKRATPYGVPDGAEPVGENTVLLIQIDGGRRIFTLSPVAGTYFRRRPAYLHQIVSRQNAPSLSRSDRMQKLKAGQPKTITKGKRGVEIAERQFRLPRSHKQDKSAFSPLLC
ncbi:MAG: hypothetical protein KHX46_03200, partial [Clostridiales bacterium]|nr:hypothetical protein [Clostridiales bacterium]